MEVKGHLLYSTCLVTEKGPCCSLTGVVDGTQNWSGFFEEENPKSLVVQLYPSYCSD